MLVAKKHDFVLIFFYFVAYLFSYSIKRSKRYIDFAEHLQAIGILLYDKGIPLSAFLNAKISKTAGFVFSMPYVKQGS